MKQMTANMCNIWWGISSFTSFITFTRHWRSGVLPPLSNILCWHYFTVLMMVIIC